MTMIGSDYDWSTASDSKCWHMAQAGIPAAQAELRRREAKVRTAALDPQAKAAMVSRARNGRPTP